MAGKKGASRVKPRFSIHGREESLCGSFVSSSGNNGIQTGAQRCELASPDSHHGLNPSSLSLRDEARNTERHFLWRSNIQLRHTQVNFVRAENGAPDTLTDTPDEEFKNRTTTKQAASGPAAPSAHPDTAYPSIQINPEERTVEDAGRAGGPTLGVRLNELSRTLDSPASPVPCERGFLIDTVGSGAAFDTGMMPPVLRSSSPSASSSGDEVLIFAGRSRTQRIGASQAAPVVASTTDPPRPRNGFVDTRPLEDHLTRLNPSTSDAVRAGTLPVRLMEENIMLSQPVADDRRAKQNGNNGKRKKRAKKPAVINGNTTGDAGLADYIANVSHRAQETSSFASRAIQGQDPTSTGSGKGWSETDTSNMKAPAAHKSTPRSGWNMSDIEDLGDLSTSDEVFGNIQAIISKRERPSGLQYLVVCEGYTVDDARWIAHTSLESEDVVQKIRLYEAEDKLQRHYPFADSDTILLSDGEGDQESDTDDELEALKDEEDLLRRRLERMGDEKIARLLAKQEELGMGSNEVMLFDDDFVNDVNDGDDTEADPVFPTPKKLGSVQPRREGSKRSQGAFHQASALASMLDQDSYSGFDVMDHDRPSLKTRPMGRRSARPFDVSDTELELSLSSAWHKDRLKKQAKKREREELRAQGLLGKINRKKSDLRAKYMEGVTTDQIKDEIEEFIFSTNESLSLPPMDKKDRKTVHEIANAFSLKSKSVGGGRSRFPVLFKTSRTRGLSKDAFEVIEARLSRRAFMPRMDRRGRRGPVASGRGAGAGSGPGAGGAAFSYRDGEVVGATAPELGAENKGRAMLEKMGWSTGTALGASNNKGILQPVAHVVKTGKAGLG